MMHPVSLRGLRTTGIALVALAAACNRPGDDPAGNASNAAKSDQPPVALNAESPVEYPPALYQQGIEGTVVLQLFVDKEGRTVPESTRVAESSGQPALDSAALAAAPKLRFAPALRNGAPVAAPFLQPIHFRNPEHGGAGQ